MTTKVSPSVECTVIWLLYSDGTDEMMSIKAYQKYIDEQDEIAAYERAREAVDFDN